MLKIPIYNITTLIVREFYGIEFTIAVGELQHGNIDTILKINILLSVKETIVSFVRLQITIYNIIIVLQPKCNYFVAVTRRLFNVVVPASFKLAHLPPLL